MHVFLLVLSFSSCQRPEGTEHETTIIPDKIIELEVVAHASLEKPIKNLLEKFAASQSKDHALTLNIVVTPHFEDAEQIADGRIKNDLWFSAGEHPVAWANDHLENLGAPHHNCTPFGFSPIQLIGTKELKDQACDPATGCLWESLITAVSHAQNTISNSPPSENKFGSILALTAPEFGPIESLAWATLFHFEGTNVLKYRSSLSQSQSSDNDPAFATISIMPLPDFWAIFDKFRGAKAGEYYLSLAPEALVHQYHQERKDGSQIQFLPLKERDPVYHTLTLCSSSGDWVTGEKHAIIQELRAFLHSDQAKEIIHGFGYNTEGISALQPTWTKVKELRTATANSWDHLRPNKALLIALDTSGSLEVEQRMYDVRRALSKLVAIAPPQDHLALMSFATTPTMRVRFNDNRSRITDELSKITPLGGSAVYDAIAAGFDHLKVAPEESTRQLLLITDGGDIRSKLQKEQILQLAARSPEWRKVDFVVIGLLGEGSELDDMREIATAVNGRFFEISSQHLERIFTEIFEPKTVVKLLNKELVRQVNEQLTGPDAEQFFVESGSDSNQATPP